MSDPTFDDSFEALGVSTDIVVSKGNIHVLKEDFLIDIFETRSREYQGTVWLTLKSPEEPIDVESMPNEQLIHIVEKGISCGAMFEAVPYSRIYH